MLHKTQAIVLHYLKYTDTSVIAHLYTEKFGRQSYIFSGIRSKKAKGKINYLQPLQILELEVYYKPKNNLQRISEFRPAYNYHSLNTTVVKLTVLMFLSEVLYKCIKEEEANSKLFEFLVNSILYFDTMQSGETYFHLVFLMQLTRFLGFFPAKNYSNKTMYFNMNEGIYVPGYIGANITFNANISRLIYVLSNTAFSELGKFSISNADKKSLLKSLIQYYQFHISGLKNLKSLEVFTEVFS